MLLEQHMGFHLGQSHKNRGVSKFIEDVNGGPNLQTLKNAMR